VTGAAPNESALECARKVEELVAVIGRYKRIREQ
jgi:hypothetical protein